MSWVDLLVSERWRRREWDSAVLLLVWGAWLATPWARLASIGLPRHLPEVPWGIGAATLAVAQFGALVAEERGRICAERTLRWAAALSLGNWLHFAILVVAENRTSPSLPIFLWLAYRSFASFLHFLPR